jgi:hypothetical protein
MLRIVVLALLLILGGTSFTSSPAQAQRPVTRFAPATPTVASHWCGRTFLSYCEPPYVPVCISQIPCSYFGQQA